MVCELSQLVSDMNGETWLSMEVAEQHGTNAEWIEKLASVLTDADRRIGRVIVRILSGGRHVYAFVLWLGPRRELNGETERMLTLHYGE